MKIIYKGHDDLVLRVDLRDSDGSRIEPSECRKFKIKLYTTTESSFVGYGASDVRDGAVYVDGADLRNLPDGSLDMKFELGKDDPGFADGTLDKTVVRHTGFFLKEGEGSEDADRAVSAVAEQERKSLAAVEAAGKSAVGSVGEQERKSLAAVEAAGADRAKEAEDAAVKTVKSQQDASVAAVSDQESESVQNVKSQEASSVSAVRSAEASKITDAESAAIAAVRAQENSSVAAVQSAEAAKIKDAESAAVQAVADQQSASVGAVSSQEAESVQAVRDQQSASVGALKEQEEKSAERLAGIGGFDPSKYYTRDEVDALLVPAGVVPIPLEDEVFQLFKSYDSDGDGKLKYSEAAKITDISPMKNLPEGVTGRGISYFSGVKSVPDSAFWGSGKLSLAELPRSIESIETDAFGFCFDLALGTLPEKLKTIGRRAFASCESLALTKLPAGLTEILKSAFNGCLKVAIAELPAALTRLEHKAFGSCTAMKGKPIACLAAVPPVVGDDGQNNDGDPFSSAEPSAIYVPDASVNAYEAAQGWSKYASVIKPLSERPAEG